MSKAPVTEHKARFQGAGRHGRCPEPRKAEEELSALHYPGLVQEVWICVAFARNRSIAVTTRAFQLWTGPRSASVPVLRDALPRSGRLGAGAGCRTAGEIVMSARKTERKVLLLQGTRPLPEGALARGMPFLSGYPSPQPLRSPSTWPSKLRPWAEASSRWRTRLPVWGAVIGASLAGVKAMTATSGPGFS